MIITLDKYKEFINEMYDDSLHNHYLDPYSKKIKDTIDSNPEEANDEINRIKEKISNFSIKKSLLKWIKNTQNKTKEERIKILSKILISLMTIVNISPFISMVKSETGLDLTEVIEMETKKDDKKVIAKSIQSLKVPTIKYNKTGNRPVEYLDILVDFLKYEEGSINKDSSPVLTAYKLGDGMVTIGYGHAERIQDTKMVPNKTKITYDEAIDLLLEDIKEAQKQVDYYLDKFIKDKDIKLTPGQYTAIISMTYNMGIGNMIKSDFFKAIIKGNFKLASSLITKTNVTYPGHVHRRDKEKQIFDSDHNIKIDNIINNG